MKTISASLLLTSVLLLSSCIFSINKNNREFNRSEVLGKWEITKSSLRQVKRDEEVHNIITAFELKADSTIDAIWGDSKPTHHTGTWKWQPDKRIGKEKFGFNFQSDVSVVSGHHLLWLMIMEKDDEMYLNANSYQFKKQ